SSSWTFRKRSWLPQVFVDSSRKRGLTGRTSRSHDLKARVAPASCQLWPHASSLSPSFPVSRRASFCSTRAVSCRLDRPTRYGNGLRCQTPFNGYSKEPLFGTAVRRSSAGIHLQAHPLLY